MMVSRLLDEGTENRTSLEIAEAIESVGGAIEADGSFERIVVSAGVLKKDIDLGLELLADLLIRPIFPQEYVEKEKDRTLSEIASAKDRPQVIAGWAFNELVYQDHPLHRPSMAIRRRSATDPRRICSNFTSTYFVPNNAILSIVGDFRVSELLPKIEKAFGSWPSQAGRCFRHIRRLCAKRTSGRSTSPCRRSSSIFILGISESREPIRITTHFRCSIRFSVAAPDSPREFRSGLRDELGLAYTTFASITMTAGSDPGRFVAFIGTSPENMKLAIEGLDE